MNSEALLEQNLPLVKSIAIKYSTCEAIFDDLVQEGLIGVLEASRNFDPMRNVKFSTYAYYHIKKRISSAFTKHHELISLPNVESLPDPQPQSRIDQDSQGEQSLALPPCIPPLEERILRLNFEQKQSLKDIAIELGFRVEKVRYLKAKALRRLRIELQPDQQAGR